MHSTTISVTGNVATEVRFTTTQDGTPLATFRMAATERKFDKLTSRWIDGDVTWFSVSMWRSLAENVSASIHKGDPVFVVGRLTLREWERDGKAGMSLDINADLVGHDLNRGTATFERIRKVTSETPESIVA